MKLFKQIITAILMVAMILGLAGMFILTALSLDEYAMLGLAIGIVSWAILLGLDWDIYEF